MRVFLAGASGVIGLRLVPLLVAAGHDVAGMTRTQAKAERLRGLGAEPVVCDVFDLDALSQAVSGFGPDAVVHQLTDLPDDPARIPELAGERPDASPRNSQPARRGQGRRRGALRRPERCLADTR